MIARTAADSNPAQDWLPAMEIPKHWGLGFQGLGFRVRLMQGCVKSRSAVSQHFPADQQSLGSKRVAEALPSSFGCLLEQSNPEMPEADISYTKTEGAGSSAECIYCFPFGVYVHIVWVI